MNNEVMRLMRWGNSFLLRLFCLLNEVEMRFEMSNINHQLSVRQNLQYRCPTQLFLHFVVGKLKYNPDAERKSIKIRTPFLPHSTNKTTSVAVSGKHQDKNLITSFMKIEYSKIKKIKCLHKNLRNISNFINKLFVRKQMNNEVMRLMRWGNSFLLRLFCLLNEVEMMFEIPIKNHISTSLNNQSKIKNQKW